MQYIKEKRSAFMGKIQCKYYVYDDHKKIMLLLCTHSAISKWTGTNKDFSGIKDVPCHHTNKHSLHKCDKQNILGSPIYYRWPQ